MKVVTNAPRRLRAHLRRLATTGQRKIKIVKTEKGWRFAIPNGNDLVCVGKPVATRDEARRVAPLRFNGHKASEYRQKRTKRKAA
jgi:hypothetical protein